MQAVSPSPPLVLAALMTAQPASVTNSLPSVPNESGAPKRQVGEPPSLAILPSPVIPTLDTIRESSSVSRTHGPIYLTKPEDASRPISPPPPVTYTVEVPPARATDSADYSVVRTTHPPDAADGSYSLPSTASSVDKVHKSIQSLPEHATSALSSARPLSIPGNTPGPDTQASPRNILATHPIGTIPMPLALPSQYLESTRGSVVQQTHPC